MKAEASRLIFLK